MVVRSGDAFKELTILTDGLDSGFRLYALDCMLYALDQRLQASHSIKTSIIDSTSAAMTRKVTLELSGELSVVNRSRNSSPKMIASVKGKYPLDKEEWAIFH